LSDPFAKYADVELPVIFIGIPAAKDIAVKLSIVQDDNNAATGQYELLGGYIPAGKTKGNMLLRVYNDPELGSKTRQLRLTIDATDDYKCGPEAYINAVVYWNNMLPIPTNTAFIRTYNMLIQSNLSFISTALTYYSPLAHKVILQALGWANLVNYSTLVTGNVYLGYAKILEDYITEYNATHSEPLLHDAGGYIGQPIEARKY
jgi:hypothetical protein